MRILITGAGGMLGQDVGRSVVALGHEPVCLARSDLDISDGGAVAQVVSAAGARVVVNCAAWTDVDGAEGNEEAAFEVNARGAGLVARAAADAGAWTIHVSSDYVFDGSKGGAYVESDAVGPVSAYGRSKLAGERVVAEAAPGAHTIVRSSWLFGAGGRCFPQTILRLASEREHLEVVSDQVGCPTFTAHLADALVGLALEPRLGVLHVAGQGHCSWFEFARAVVAAGGLDCVVRPIGSEQYPQAARRPANSALVSERDAPRLASWQDGLARFVGGLAEASR
jgi:dTDP-4-dehydrorhamnose reductase